MGMGASMQAHCIQVAVHRIIPMQVKIKDLGPVTKPGSGRRSGPVASDFAPWASLVAEEVAAARAKEIAPIDDDMDSVPTPPAPTAQAVTEGVETDKTANGVPAAGTFLVKRKKLELVLR